MAADALQGMRILVVEDESLLAMNLEMLLEDLGCKVVGPAPTLGAAIELAREAALDGAILDVNLDGNYVFPAVDILQNRSIPIILVTGYGSSAPFPENARDLPYLEKPYDEHTLENMLRNTFARVS